MERIKDDSGNTIEIAVSWCKEDVRGIAESSGIELSDHEIGEILNSMIDDHDAQHGITWDTIQYYVDEIKQERRKIK